MIFCKISRLVNYFDAARFARFLFSSDIKLRKLIKMDSSCSSRVIFAFICLRSSGQQFFSNMSYTAVISAVWRDICVKKISSCWQCQAIVVGFLGSVVAIVMGAFRNGTISLDHAYLLCASSLVTASLASFVLGLITAGVIVFSRHCHINPDNVATPIAASLGDITSLALLSWISTILYESINKQDWVAPLVIACYILVTPLWVWIAKRNKYTNDVLYFGWTPVMIAMLISR